MNQVESAGLTDIGRKRQLNQDAYFLDNVLGLYVVADGMGGHKAGEVASRMVVETLRNSIAFPEKTRLVPHGDASLSPEANRLLGAIDLANQDVYKTSRDNDAFQGMGSTVSAVCLSGNTIIAANVGDSPIYLIHRRQINEISVRHTLAAEQAAADPDGDARPDGALHHILTRAIGVRETVSPHICEIQGFKGDILVIGSDGLSNKVDREEIGKVAQSMSPEKACRHLVELANQRGGEDNISVVIARIGSSAFTYRRVARSLAHFFRQAFYGFRNNTSNCVKEGSECQS